MPSRNRLNTALVSALLLLLSGRVVADSVLYVDDDAPPGGNGTNWESAYRFLQDALAHADSPLIWAHMNTSLDGRRQITPICTSL